jgi:hypothetical protein
MRMPYPVFAALDREWRTFAASAQVAAALTRWGRAEPALAGFESVDDVLACRPDAERGPAALRALATRAATDEVAARVVLQAMLPGLVRLTVNAGDRDPDAAAHVLAIAWERIRTYGSDRRSAFATNLLLDVRKALLAERACLPADPWRVEESISAEDEALPWLFVWELAAREKAGDLPAGATELLVRNRVEGHSIVDLAARRGVSEHGLLQRRLRAEHRLRRDLAA